MNKLKLMSQKSLKDVILYAATSEPGISSEKLWRTVKDWNATTVAAFERTLADVRGCELRCTNKTWYAQGSTRQLATREPKVDPRQTRMF